MSTFNENKAIIPINSLPLHSANSSDNSVQDDPIHKYPPNVILQLVHKANNRLLESDNIISRLKSLKRNYTDYYNNNRNIIKLSFAFGLSSFAFVMAKKNRISRIFNTSAVASISLGLLYKDQLLSFKKNIVDRKQV
ncbi:hypothetical protein GJ496_000830 [Pomphorhynchus laevis]|nr:hypothetical protein GJ496_000830 [Pomphorhynchus laevis]